MPDSAEQKLERRRHQRELLDETVEAPKPMVLMTTSSSDGRIRRTLELVRLSRVASAHPQE